MFDKAIFVTSDASGRYQVVLTPGEYWIGPSGKALDPLNYPGGAVEFSTMVVKVNEGEFTTVDISEIGFAY